MMSAEDFEALKEFRKHKRAKKQDSRVAHGINVLTEMGFDVGESADGTTLTFEYRGNTIRYYPYSGWHSGKGIKDGRGFKNLVKQLGGK